MEKAPNSETANAGDAAKTAATTSQRLIQSNSESKSQSRSTSQSQSLSQKSQSRSRRQSQNQSYSESRSGIVDGKMRAAEQRVIWKSGQKMTQIVPVTADDGKVGDAHRAAEDCGKVGDAPHGLRASDSSTAGDQERRDPPRWRGARSSRPGVLRYRAPRL